MADEPGVSKSEAALREEAVLEFWKENKIFEKSLTKPAPQGEFVFYEGPPTANAKPALHHLEARAFKDAIPRYKTMRGYHVRRKAGWDTHGLPVELQIEKELGFTGKPDIEKYGVEAFNEKCRESVYRYIGEWEKFTDRIGYWVDKSDAYYTFDTAYIESLWSILAKVYNDNRVYADYKVVPWCARCGTALSTHELAQGYKDVKDLSVTVKFKVKNPEKHNLPENTFILAWTTTPWTLPGNVGLAVGKDIEYKVFEVNGEHVIAAAAYAPLAPSGTEASGSQSLAARTAPPLEGIEYEPLYPHLAALIDGDEKKKMDNAYKVYAADFVTTTDGTGVVHTAVMYGADDFDLGTKVGLPKFHLVKPDGKFVDGTDFLSGRFVKDEEVTVDIIKDLAHRGVLFSKEKYEHTYPFCWRCSTPLIYYARDSWYIRMSEVRAELVAENQKINWEPAHIRDGRMGEWLAGDKDWAISRERYWGTPLPIWQSEDKKERIVIGSIDELKKRVKKSGNKYFIARHGESTKNVVNLIRSVLSEDDVHLTEKGKVEAAAMGEKLKSEHIDVIISSPYIRTKETAEIIRTTLGLASEVMLDDRLQEYNHGDFNGKPLDEFLATYTSGEMLIDTGPKGGESINDVKRRGGDVLYELEGKYSGKNILIVSHGWPLAQLKAVAHAADRQETIRKAWDEEPDPGTVSELMFVPLPHNKNYELDLHKPYIDQVTLIGDSGAELKRTPEVMDVWFDSGSMPFAQDHYPFENKAFIDGPGYPADFISEAIDQTRGWFYTLLAVGVLMGRGTPYKNVICLGHLLDEKGAKMSKSKGNVIEPFAAMDEHGADLLRYWMYSVNAPGEGKSYDLKVLAEVKSKVFNTLQNALQFYLMYKDERVVQKEESEHVLDRWILSKMNSMLSDMTTAFDAYDILGASRPVRAFIEDFSTWYIRRSRDRLKGDDEQDKQAALNTMHMVLEHLSRAMAPLTPFFAEYVYRAVRSDSDPDPESVHLCDWPEAWAADPALEADMDTVRAVVTLALEARQKANIKVRQPLQKLTIKDVALKGKDELLQLIKDEINVKEVVVDESIADPVILDTTLTDALREEGELRDLIREVQDLRKAAGLNPKDEAVLSVPDDRMAQVDKHWAGLAKATGLKTKQTGPILAVHKST